MTTVRQLPGNSLADYYAVTDGDKTVSVRFSLRFPVPPLCLTCVKFDCAHAEHIADYLETKPASVAA